MVYCYLNITLKNLIFVEFLILKFTHFNCTVYNPLIFT